MPLELVVDLVDYWRSGYGWRAHEARLNTFEQHRTMIDGQQFHFLRVRSPEPQALPLLMIHGWPGSVAEFMDVIGPLTDPVAYGGVASDAFHLVIPALPGFGFSGPTADQGWNSARTAAAFAALMSRLGYGRYGAQGGDLGALVAPEIGQVDAVADVWSGMHSQVRRSPALTARYRCASCKRLCPRGASMTVRESFQAQLLDP